MHSPFMVPLLQNQTSHHSASSYLASKRADAAAELAAKEAEYKIIEEERKLKEKLKALEEQHKKKNGNPKVRVGTSAS